MAQVQLPPSEFPSVKAQELSRRLEQVITGEVRFDAGSRALYATDGSLYRQVPVGVVVPRSVEDVKQTVALCNEFGAPVLARGAGTSLAGQTCNIAVVIDFSKHLNKLLDLNPERRLARVQPGCVLDDLRDAAEEYHLTFAPDPSTHTHNCLGGMLGNNSCGIHSIMAGRTADNVRSMKIMTYDGVEMEVGPTSEHELTRIIAEGGRRGEIYRGLKEIRDRYATLIRERYPQIPRRVSGYNLDQLLPEKGFNVARALVGSEGTCVTILEAELELVHSPPERCLLVLGYNDVYITGDHVAEILEFGPTGLEGMDHVLLAEMKAKQMNEEGRTLLPEGNSWLFVEFGGETGDEAKDKADAVVEFLQGCEVVPSTAIYQDLHERKTIWETRESGLGATSRSPALGDTFPGWEDAAVPPEKVGVYLKDFRQLMHRYGYDAALYGHFGDGCIHCRINFDVQTKSGLAKWRAFMEEAADLVVSYGGSLSGEHGDGQVRAELLPRMYGEDMVDIFRQFKSLWDPHGRMNPGKIVDPYPINTNLRAGPEWRKPVLKTAFAFHDDQYSFTRATDRCVGIGNCRRMSGGVMCPSYRATKEEKHTTRGRSRLLFEMLKGETIIDGWRSEAVHDALDLCLACKGCKKDCPVDVDMATLKAEFMGHYYKRRLRPRAAYSMGLIWWWSRVATHVPRVANFFLGTPPFAKVSKWIGGIAQERAMPRYAKESFRRWFTKREVTNEGQPKVILWPDTFNNHFYPEILQASVRVLEAAGYQVIIPPRSLCCSRPLYAEGMLDLARHQLGDILDALEPHANEHLTLVGLEPSCVASFRDELPQLFQGDERAHYWATHTQLLTEFLHQNGYHPPQLERRAVVHTHCHQHASLHADADRVLLNRMGIDFELLDAGCCGMAGSFGFDAHKYDVAQAIGELQLMPAIRATSTDTLIITNGFSCKEQIAQATGRTTVNMAELLDLAIAEKGPALEILASTGATTSHS